jgi:hypothetical protein
MRSFWFKIRPGRLSGHAQSPFSQWHHNRVAADARLSACFSCRRGERYTQHVIHAHSNLFYLRCETILTRLTGIRRVAIRGQRRATLAHSGFVSLQEPVHRLASGQFLIEVGDIVCRKPHCTAGFYATGSSCRPNGLS